MSETLVFDFVAHEVLLVDTAGHQRPAPRDLTLVGVASPAPRHSGPEPK